MATETQHKWKLKGVRVEREITRLQSHVVSAVGLYQSSLSAGVFAGIVTVILTLLAFVYGGFPLAMILASASTISIFGWRINVLSSCYDKAAAFNILVGTIVALTVFYSEQWLGNYPRVVEAMFPGYFPPGIGISRHAFVAIFPLAGNATLVLGALLYFHQLKIGHFAAWLTFGWAVAISCSVYLMPIVAGKLQYVPGMATALLPLVLAVIGMRRLARGARVRRTSQGATQPPPDAGATK